MMMFGKSLTLCLAFLLLGRRQELAQACTYFDGGDSIPSILELPVFETTVAEVEASAALAIEKIDVVLQDLLSLVSTVNVTTTTAQEKQQQPISSASFEDSPLAIMNRGITEMLMDLYRFSAISSVFEEKDMVDAGYNALLQVYGHYANVLLNADLYKIFIDFRDFDPVVMGLTGERRRLLDVLIQHMELNGVGGLDKETTLQVQETLNRISQLETNLNINVASVSAIVNFTLEELDGLSDDQIDLLDFDNITGLYSLDTRVANDIYDVLVYANNRETRVKVIVASETRIRDENAPLIHELVSLRQQAAELLGYPTWADYKLADKMALNLDTAHGFVKDLSDRLYPTYKQEMQQLVNLNNELEGTSTFTLDNFQQADYGYLQSIFRERASGINEEEAAEYFEEKATIRALFDIYERLFGIVITIETELENKWTDDLQLATIANAEDGSVIAAIYMDLHPRDLKYTHFAFAPLFLGHVRSDGSYQAPVGMIMGNWPEPTVDLPSLWTLYEVETMFHEFGHAIHHALTCTEFAYLSGINVVWDFVEAPSQMLEYWLKDPNVVTSISRHFETGEPMSMEMANQLIASGRQLPAIMEVRQAAYALLDLEIHSYTSAEEVPKDGYEIYKASNYFYHDFRLLVPPQDDLAPLSAFGHLWGGYDAGYYGYAWSRVIAADLAREFRMAPNGYYDQVLGARYRKEILEKGNSAHPNELIYNFLGRNFTSDAFFDDLNEAIAANEALDETEDEDVNIDDGSHAFHWKGASAAVTVIVSFALAIML